MTIREVMSIFQDEAAAVTAPGAPEPPEPTSTPTAPLQREMLRLAHVEVF